MLGRRLVSIIKEMPPVRALRRLRHARRFSSSAGYGSFWGVYASFAEALRAVPRGNPVGFDSEALACEFSDRLDHVFTYDYPVMFWLAMLLREDRSVFDIGGHVGVHYYAYRKYIEGLESVRWVVSEVPKVAARGRELAAGRGAQNLAFTSDLQDVAGHDVVIAAGSLQYIERPLFAELLGSIRQRLRPRHLIVNKIPLYGGATFVTLQNAGVSNTPCYNFNGAEFVGGLEKLGYRIVDSWSVPERSNHIPLHPERSFGSYSGLYFAMR